MPKYFFRLSHPIKQLVILTAIGFFCACRNYANFSDYYQVNVVRVVDGDTIVLANGKYLRYLGIDTPETHLKNHDGTWREAFQTFGKEATEFNRRLVEGKIIRVEFDVQKNDKYNRLLGYCYLPGGEMVNAKMLEEGFATLFIKAPNVKHADVFIAAQTRARENRKNLWGNYEAIDASDAKEYINQIRTVRGRVEKTYDSGKVILLNFGKKRKKSFTVVIFDDARQFFCKKNINPANFYTGKAIEVSGRVRDYKDKPEIIVSMPEEITILEDNVLPSVQPAEERKPKKKTINKSGTLY
jgi:micrococcal nuclease